MRQLPHKGGDDPPRSRTWTLSFSFSRHDPENGTERAAFFVKRLRVLDLVVAAALLILAVVEPFGVYLYLTRHGSLVAAESCQSRGGNVVVVHPRSDAEIAEAGRGLAPGQEFGASGDVITPLNVRDPSALVMGPGINNAQPLPQPAVAAPVKDSAGDKVLEAAGEGSKAKAKPPHQGN